VPEEQQRHRLAKVLRRKRFLKEGFTAGKDRRCLEQPTTDTIEERVGMFSSRDRLAFAADSFNVLGSPCTTDASLTFTEWGHWWVDMLT
jgi:hypothetical protein